MSISIEFINSEWAADWEKAKAEYGAAAAVPHEVTSKISEKNRALYVLLSNPEADPVPVLKNYNVSTSMIEEIGELLGVDVDVESSPGPRPKIADKYGALDEWAKEHPGEQIAPDGLVDLSGLSYASVMKYLKDTPRYKKVKNGVYEAYFDQPK